MNATCPRCGAEVASAAKFCVMCGYQVVSAAVPVAAAYGTSTLTGSGLVVSLATAAIGAGILIGAIVLAESFI